VTPARTRCHQTSDDWRQHGLSWLHSSPRRRTSLPADRLFLSV